MNQHLPEDARKASRSPGSPVPRRITRVRVVSLSALEHIPVDVLPDALKEIDRLMKPGSFRAVTTSATEKPTWFHEPSMGMCFSKEDIEKLFAAEQIGSSAPAVLLDKYRANRYLPEHLARFYKKSGNNGMPWGVWDPQYIPVGIRN